jgi:hypothetical protein
MGSSCSAASLGKVEQHHISRNPASLVADPVLAFQGRRSTAFDMPPSSAATSLTISSPSHDRIASSRAAPSFTLAVFIPQLSCGTPQEHEEGSAPFDPCGKSGDGVSASRPGVHGDVEAPTGHKNNVPVVDSNCSNICVSKRSNVPTRSANVDDARCNPLSDGGILFVAAHDAVSLDSAAYPLHRCGSVTSRGSVSSASAAPQAGRAPLRMLLPQFSAMTW